MYNSLFLAKAIGLTYLLIGVGMLLNPRVLKPVLNNYMNSSSACFLGGVVALIIGALIVTNHNLWVLDWRVLITITGWLALLEGVAFGLFPQFITKPVTKWIVNGSGYTFGALFTLIVGAFLLYEGYVAYGGL